MPKIDPPRPAASRAACGSSASGLTADDRIIINGLIRARPGRKVTPEDGKIEPEATAAGGRLTMRFSHFFIDRPIFAAVISILITLIGGIAYFTPAGRAISGDRAADDRGVGAAIPAPPPRSSPRPSPTPLEQEINGVENMLYMSSQSTGDGNCRSPSPSSSAPISNQAQVLVQNRVAIAEPRLPEEVRRLGVTTAKNSPDLMMVIHLSSPDGSRDQLYISNYATLQIKDVLARLDGVGDVQHLRRARLLDARLARSGEPRRAAT